MYRGFRGDRLLPYPSLPGQDESKSDRNLHLLTFEETLLLYQQLNALVQHG